jgi:hypothetical protein
MAVSTATGKSVEVRPITETDVASVAEFLHTNLNARVGEADWRAAVDVPWACARPNAGLMLLDGDTIVGAHLAFYSERLIDGRLERFCNLGAWCVLPDYRFHGLRLLKQLLAQDGYHFTDLSPSGSVIALNERLGFRRLDTTTAVLPNLPWPSVPGRAAITSRPAEIERALQGDQLRIYQDHAGARGARHLLLARGEEHCHVIFRKDRRKGLPVFASILYVSNAELFGAMARHVGRHLLARHGAAATLIERAVAAPPRGARTVSLQRVKMFKSPTLAPEQIDYLYSELTCLAW